jgi:hypothetical protein
MPRLAIIGYSTRTGRLVSDEKGTMHKECQLSNNTWREIRSSQIYRQD